ncbi:MAG: hypothetical protein GXO61_02340 [Epsilonproteobacteria bacterium]|nr:hypothetical protein [Campylobacterota bacterium]
MRKEAITKIKRSWKKFNLVLLREYRESKKMLEIYKNKREDKELVKEANRQLVDIFKIIMLFPISLLPGSVVIVTVLEIIAKAFGGTIFPKKQRF